MLKIYINYSKNTQTMETNELLRAGNWVKIQGQEVQLITDPNGRYSAHFDGGTFCSYGHENIDPIPLTKEWLFKLGFDECTYMLEGTKFEFINLHGRIVVLFNSVHLEHINSVHRLQNLYFTMTGNELTVKGETVLDRLKEASCGIYTSIIQDIENGVITKLK